MIQELTYQDIKQVAKLHKQELSGFLSELGVELLEKFYKVSLDIPEMFTLVEKENEQVLGFVSATATTKGLYKKIIFKDALSFAKLFLRYFFTQPKKIVKIVKVLTYPGFSSNSPELLTIAVAGKHQKKGIGSKLFLKVVEEFKKTDRGKFFVSIYDKLPANEFYKKMGCKFNRSFNFLGEKMNYYSYKIK